MNDAEIRSIFDPWSIDTASIAPGRPEPDPKPNSEPITPTAEELAEVKRREFEAKRREIEQDQRRDEFWAMREDWQRARRHFAPTPHRGRWPG